MEDFDSVGATLRLEILAAVFSLAVKDPDQVEVVRVRLPSDHTACFATMIDSGIVVVIVLSGQPGSEHILST